MFLIKCCHKCENRQVGCHAYCEQYIQERARYDSDKKHIENCKSTDKAYQDFRCNAFDRINRVNERSVAHIKNNEKQNSK